MADTLKNVKLSSDERDKLRDLVEQGDNDQTQVAIKNLLDELTAVEGKRNRQDEKKLQKIASLYDTHNFWDT